jgi:hypothetical protein
MKNNGMRGPVSRPFFPGGADASVGSRQAVDPSLGRVGAVPLTCFSSYPARMELRFIQ